MVSSPEIRDALRIYRLILLLKLLFVSLSFLAAVSFGASFGYLFVRVMPTLLLAVLFLPPLLEPVLGRYFLAAALGLDLLFSSLEAAYLYAGPLSGLAALGLPPAMIQALSQAPPIEPFFFLLIPLVLAGWAYGRRGALLASTWAAGLHLGTGLWLSSMQGSLRAFVPPALARVALLYVVPFIVSALAERERQQHADLQAAHQRLRRHAATVEQLAISRERNRLARDLHDTLAHSLSALTVQLEALRSLLTHDPDAARDMAADISALARQGLEESRQAIQALRAGPVETLGLSGALQDLLESLRVRSGIQASLRVAGQARDLTAAEAETLFRIAEEALTNVEQHAAAQHVTLRLEYASNETILVIQDDGRGFDPAAVDRDRYGLAGMRERAAMIDAVLEVRSTPGPGTEVWCSVPR